MAVTSPAFQFYAAEYLADEHVQVMSLEEEGIYIRLMAYCWREGSIPSDMDKLSRLIGKGGSTSSISVVLERFNQHPTEEGRMVHSRLEKERQKQAKWREKSSEGGKKSAEARSQKPKNENKRRVVEPKPNQSTKGGDTLQSSSSSSSSNTKENTKRNLDGAQGLFSELPPAKHWMIEYLEKECKEVCKMKQPLTDEEAIKLEKGYTKNFIEELFSDMDNYPPLHKSGRSSYKTFLVWARKRKSDADKGIFRGSKNPMPAPPRKLMPKLGESQ